MDYTIKELAEISVTQHPGVDDAALHQAEQALGGTFPQQYKDLVKLINAPEFFDWSFFPVKDPHNPDYSFDDVVLHNTGKQRPPFLLPSFVAFAESIGDYLCFKIVDGHMEDAIYIHGDETQSPEPVAPDLKSALLEIMSYAEDDEDIELLEDDHDENDDH